MAGVLDILADGELQQQISANTKSFSKYLDELISHKAVKSIRSQGMLAAIETNLSSFDWNSLIDAGFHAQAKDETIILAPALTMDEKLMEQLFYSLKSVLGGSV